MSLFGFSIPHEKVQVVRDLIKVQMPFPPRRIGSILTPDSWRELSQHTHQMGVIRDMGPLAFQYKDGERVRKHGDVQIGDWVMFKWGAGTSFQASKGTVVSGGWRYLSSFNDVVAVAKACDMPDTATLCWDEGEDDAPEVKQTDFDFDGRKTVALDGNGIGAPAIIRGS